MLCASFFGFNGVGQTHFSKLFDCSSEHMHTVRAKATRGVYHKAHIRFIHHTIQHKYLLWNISCRVFDLLMMSRFVMCWLASTFSSTTRIFWIHYIMFYAYSHINVCINTCNKFNMIERRRRWLRARILVLCVIIGCVWLVAPLFSNCCDDC